MVYAGLGWSYTQHTSTYCVQADPLYDPYWPQTQGNTLQYCATLRLDVAWVRGCQSAYEFLPGFSGFSAVRGRQYKHRIPLRCQ